VSNFPVRARSPRSFHSLKHLKNSYFFSKHKLFALTRINAW
jgi:hypothetical protein